MPGLSAIVHLDGAPADSRVLARCNAAAAHRGASVAAYVEGPTALAFLSRDDPPPPNLLGGRSEAGLSLVLTGGLYNRGDLLANGGGETLSDAQLILVAYRRWGADCLPHLDGDFAFVLHDAERNLVVCARDPLGVHPLCYSFDGRRLVAGSEPRQVLAAGVSSEPCEESIAAYVAATRHLAGGPRTFYRDVFRVEPGHVLELRGGSSRSRRYWQLDPHRQLEERTDEAMAERVRELMTDAVRRRVPESGPYSCALSGGFDSSSVAVLFRRILAASGKAPTLETFSFELRDLESDEPELIDAVSRHLGSNHHHIYLDEDNVFAVLPQMLAACDEPTFDMGLLYLWRKKECAARQGVKVMLSGLGGDELFVGQFHYLSDLLRRLDLATLWAEVKGVYPVDRNKGTRTSLEKLLRYYAIGPLVPQPLKRLARRVFRGQGSVPPWVDRSLARRVGLPDRMKAGPPRLYADAYRQDCFEVFQSSLVGVTLPLHEALGAAFGIETRFPLLDKHLVEYMFAAPREQKIRRGEVRRLQRRALAGILPEAVLGRHVKKNINPVLRRQQRKNFAVELERLFAAGRLRAEEYLDAGHLRASYERLVADRAGPRDNLVLWYAMNLEKWLEGLRP